MRPGLLCGPSTCSSSFGNLEAYLMPETLTEAPLSLAGTRTRPVDRLEKCDRLVCNWGRPHQSVDRGTALRYEVIGSLSNRLGSNQGLTGVSGCPVSAELRQFYIAGPIFTPAGEEAEKR